jgi:hypothetical protein
MILYASLWRNQRDIAPANSARSEEPIKVFFFYGFFALKFCGNTQLYRDIEMKSGGTAVVGSLGCNDVSCS